MLDKSKLTGRKAIIMFHRSCIKTKAKELEALKQECRQFEINVTKVIYDDAENSFIAYKKIREHLEKNSAESKLPLLLINNADLFIPEHFLSAVHLKCLLELKQVEICLYDYGFEQNKLTLSTPKLNVPDIVKLKSL